MKKMILSLLVLSSVVAHSSELDNLIDTSNAIVDQIDRGIKLVGAAQGYAYTGSGLSDGTLSSTAHISAEQLQAYNNALSGMSNYKAFGDLQTVLEEKAYTELDMMDEAIGVFTEVVVDMIAVQEVAEVSESASSPQEEAEVQTFVENNIEVLTITQEEVDTYNTSMDDIETHANNASAYLAVAANADAVGFLQQGAENKNTTAEQATLSYNANQQWVSMQWANTNNATAVYLNGQNFGLDLYVTEAEVLAVGSESEYYLTGPTAQSYDCFMNETNCVEL